MEGTYVNGEKHGVFMVFQGNSSFEENWNMGVKSYS